jgi:hypothetical protein
MSKYTAAVILVSPARLHPWGDDGWRFSGAMQVVHDGPDWLYAQWPVLDGEEHHGSEQYATLVLRDGATEIAEDIVAMAFALLQVPQWKQLMSWWGSPAERKRLTQTLREIAGTYAGQYKLAVVQTSSKFEDEVFPGLRALGFEVVHFAASDA